MVPREIWWMKCVVGLAVFLALLMLIGLPIAMHPSTLGSQGFLTEERYQELMKPWFMDREQHRAIQARIDALPEDDAFYGLDLGPYLFPADRLRQKVESGWYTEWANRRGQ